MTNKLNILLKTIFQWIVGPKPEKDFDVGNLSREEIERLALYTQVKYKKCRVNHLISIFVISLSSGIITSYRIDDLSMFSTTMAFIAIYSIYLYYRNNFETDLENAQEELNGWFRKQRDD